MHNPLECDHIFMDSFYTRHALAEVVKKMTDNRCKITGIVKMNLVDSANKPNMKKAIQEIEPKPKGSWALVRAHNPVKNLDKLKREHKKVSKEPFVPPTTNVAENAGYIVFKDKNRGFSHQ